MKKETDKDALEKLVNLTKRMKKENIKVAPKSPPKGANKWRSADATFAAKPKKPENLVDGGGMQVDPSLKSEYDAWRETKLEEQRDRLAARARKAEADQKRREAEEKSGF